MRHRTPRHGNLTENMALPPPGRRPATARIPASNSKPKQSYTSHAYLESGIGAVLPPGPVPRLHDRRSSVEVFHHKYHVFEPERYGQFFSYHPERLIEHHVHQFLQGQPIKQARSKQASNKQAMSKQASKKANPSGNNQT